MHGTTTRTPVEAGVESGLGRADAACWLLAIAGVSVAFRVAAALHLGNTVTPYPGIYDQVSYHTLALRVLDGHGFSFGTGWWPATQANQPTAHWSYLYVLLLAGIYKLVGPVPLVARLLQAVAVGVLQPVITYRIARRLFGERAGLVSAALVACYAYFVYYAAALVTEALYIVAILWIMDLALRLSQTTFRGQVPFRVWTQLGLALAGAVLLRQLILLVIPVIAAWLLWRIVPRSRAAIGLGVAAAIVVLAIAPCTVRNYRAFHRFVLLNTNAGFAFYWGNHPVHGTRFVPILGVEGVSYGALIPDALKTLSEADLERVLMRQAWQWVLDDPRRFVLLSISRAKEYVKFWPSAGSGTLSNYSRVLSFGICLPFFVSGVVLALRPKPHLPSPGVWLLLAFALSYSLVHLVSWTLVRYRLPVDAVLVPFAGLSMIRACDGLRRRGIPACTAIQS